MAKNRTVGFLSSSRPVSGVEPLSRSVAEDPTFVKRLSLNTTVGGHLQEVLNAFAGIPSRDQSNDLPASSFVEIVRAR